MSKMVVMSFIAILAFLSTNTNVQGVINFELPKSYIQRTLGAFQKIVNNAELTNPIHAEFQQHTQIIANYEQLAVAADAAFARYDPILRNATIMQENWKDIRTAHIRFTMRMFEFCQNEQMNTEEYLRIPMEAFGDLFAETERIMVELGQEVVQQRLRREERITREVMAETALRRSQRGEDMGIPDPNNPYHGFNPINLEPDNNEQAGDINNQPMDGNYGAGNVGFGENLGYGGNIQSTSYGGAPTSDGNASSSSGYYGAPSFDGNPNPSSGYYGGPGSDVNPNLTYSGTPGFDENNPQSSYYRNLGFDPNADSRNRGPGGN